MSACHLGTVVRVGGERFYTVQQNAENFNNFCQSTALPPRSRILIGPGHQQAKPALMDRVAVLQMLEELHLRQSAIGHGVRLLPPDLYEVVIVGAGIAGPALAHALGTAGA